MKTHKFIYLFVLILLFSCYEDEIIKDDTVVIEDEPKITIDAEYNISVFDEDLNPVLVEASFGGQNLETSDYGTVQFDLENVNKVSEILSLKDYHGTDINYPLLSFENDINNFKIILPSQFETTELNAQDGGKVILDNTTELQFTENNFLKDGNIHLGQVELVHRVVYSPDVDTDITFPDLGAAFNSSGERVYLSPEKIVFVAAKELIVNNSFQLKEGQPNAGFDWWIFDKNAMAWQLASQKGEIWELDDLGFLAYAKSELGTIVQGNFESVVTPFAPIRYTLNDELNQHSYSTNQGNWIHSAPLDQQLNIVINKNCGEILNQDITSSSWMQTIEPIEVYDTNDDLSKVDFDIRDCDGNIEQAAYLYIDNQMPYLARGGSQKLYVPACLGEVQVLSKNTNNLSSIPLTWDLSNDVNMGSLVNCASQSEQYILMHVDGVSKIYNLPDNYKANDRIIIETNGVASSTVKMAFQNLALGELEDTDVNLFISENNLKDGYFLNCFETEFGCGTMEASISHYGENVSAYIRGSVKGNYWVKLIDAHEALYKDIEFEFLIKREF